MILLLGVSFDMVETLDADIKNLLLYMVICKLLLKVDNTTEKA